MGAYYVEPTPPPATEGWCVLRDLRASIASLKKAKSGNDPSEIRITEAIWEGVKKGRPNQTQFVKGRVDNLSKAPSGGTVIVKQPEWIEVKKSNLIKAIQLGADGRILDFETLRDIVKVFYLVPMFLKCLKGHRLKLHQTQSWIYSMGLLSH